MKLLGLGIILLAAYCSATSECRDSEDCSSGMYCYKGECFPKKDDGHSCSSDEECISSTCERSWWPAGSSCVTRCTDSSTCPDSRPICWTGDSYGSSGSERSNGGHIAARRTLEAAAAATHHQQQQQLGSRGSSSSSSSSHSQDAQGHRKHHGSGEQPQQPGGYAPPSVPHPRPGSRPSPEPEPPGSDDEGKCVECAEDRDCAEGQFCVRGYKRDAHTCEDYGRECKGFMDCPAGEFCDLSAGRCRPYYMTPDSLKQVACITVGWWC